MVEHNLSDAWTKELVSILSSEEDVWWATFTFAFDIPKATAEERLNEFIRRLRQALGLKEKEISFYPIFSLQQRKVWHIHTIIIVKGLFELDPARWERKWEEMTAFKKESLVYTKFKTRRQPSVIRRRGGKEQIVRYIRAVQNEEVKTTQLVGGGTCEIIPVGWDKEYTPERVAGYLLARHSYEIILDLEFKGAQRQFS